jgi:hypothetical protein
MNMVRPRMHGPRHDCQLGSVLRRQRAVDASAPSTARRGCLRYFFAHLAEAVCHVPPAFSQSAWVVYFEKSLDAPDGLADGDEVEEPPDVLGLMVPPEPDAPPEPLVPDVPDGVVPPELPDLLLPLPVPLVLDCAAASAGARATAATMNARRIFFILTSCGNAPHKLLTRRRWSNRQAADEDSLRGETGAIPW